MLIPRNSKYVVPFISERLIIFVPTKVDFSLAKELASTALDGQEVPCDHKVVMQDSQSQCLCLFSEDSSGLCADHVYINNY